jgi:hypothetical protein
MRREEYENLVRALLEKALALMEKKRRDYAYDEDVLSNFKRLVEAWRALRIDKLIAAGHPLAAALAMQVLKIDRIINLTLLGKKPDNESLEDSWMDELNYLLLGLACAVESVGNDNSKQ